MGKSRLSSVHTVAASDTSRCCHAPHQYCVPSAAFPPPPNPPSQMTDVAVDGGLAKDGSLPAMFVDVTETYAATEPSITLNVKVTGSDPVPLVGDIFMYSLAGYETSMGSMWTSAPCTVVFERPTPTDGVTIGFGYPASAPLSKNGYRTATMASPSASGKSNVPSAPVSR